MPPPNFHLRLTGERVTAESFPLSQLVLLLEDLRDAFASELPGGAAANAGAEGVSLVDLRSGSVCLGFALTPAAEAVAVELVAGLRKGTMRGLRLETQRVVRQLCHRLIIRDVTLEFQAGGGGPGASAVVSKDAPPPPIDRGGVVTGGTTLFCEVVRVGGAKAPRATVRRLDTQQSLTVDLTKPLARDLAAYLYKPVVLTGKAEWFREGWKLVGFTVESFRPGPDLPAPAAFAKLAEIADGAWDGVDAVEFVRDLRSDDE